MMTPKQQANILLDLRERLIIDAVNFATGREDWTLEEVKNRGELVYFGPNECVFMFDGRPMLEVYRTGTFTLHEVEHITISRTNFRKLYYAQT